MISWLRNLRRIEFPYAAVTLVSTLIVWEFAVAVFKPPAYLLPAPSAIAGDLAVHWPVLLKEAAITTYETLLGFSLSVIIAAPLAVLLSYSKPFERSIYPLIVGSQTIPKVALAPLLLAWFGFGIVPKIVIVVLVAFFPILIDSVVGLKSLSPRMLDLARSMGSSPAQIFWQFQLPNALPSIFAGMKVASTLAIIGAIVAEFVGADSGLGYIMIVAISNLDAAREFSAIIFLSAIGITFFAAIEYVERLCIPWHISVRRDYSLV
jgi:ABC-type nitrate/sulfonate/bicarbonate transport system permease component